MEDQVLDEISKSYTQATSNFSKVSRTWAFTIIVPVVTLYLEDKSLVVWFLIIMGLSVLTILLDAVHYFYSAAKLKYLLDDIYDNSVTTNGVQKKNEKMYNRLFSIIVAKFSLLVANTILLMIFLIIKAI